MKNSPIINLSNEYVLFKNQSLGKGATGEVYLGKSLKDISSVAIKIIDKKSIENEVNEYLLNMEKTALMIVNNPYILKGIEVIQDHLNFYLVTELCNGGTLKAKIKDSVFFNQQKSIRILIQILKGQVSLIEKGILHRDLKPANILMHNGHVKIIDFGYCEIKGYKRPEIDYNVGSPSYMSPESFSKNQYSEKSEIWAVGVTFYQCLTGKTIDEGRNMAEVYKQLKKNGIPYKISVSERSKTIIRWCLQPDPKNRPTCQQLLDFITPKSLQRSSHRQSARSLKVSFSSQNFEFKTNKMLRRMVSSKEMPKMPFSIYNLKKEDVLKGPVLDRKINPVRSTYQPKQIILEEKDINFSGSFKKPVLNNSQKKTFTPQFKRPLNMKTKYLPYQPQNISKYCLTSKLSQKNETIFNPLKAQISSRLRFHQTRVIKVGQNGKLTER